MRAKICIVTFNIDKPCMCGGRNPRCSRCGGLGVYQAESEPGPPGNPVSPHIDLLAKKTLDNAEAQRRAQEMGASERIAAQRQAKQRAIAALASEWEAAKRAVRTQGKHSHDARPYLRCGHCNSYDFYEDARPSKCSLCGKSGRFSR